MMHYTSKYFEKYFCLREAKKFKIISKEKFGYSGSSTNIRLDMTWKGFALIGGQIVTHNLSDIRVSFIDR